MSAKSKGLFSSLRSWLARALSPDMMQWLNGMDLPDSDKGAEMTSPYQQSAWIYIAVSCLAESVANIPFRISRVDGKEKQRISSARNPRNYKRRALWENIIEDGPAVELFDRPHPTMDRQLFWEQIISWICLRGEFFVLPLDAANEPVDLTERNPVVAQMLPLNPDLFWHVVHGYELVAWRYTGSPLISPITSHMLDPGEVIHSRNVNPYLYWRGMSPLLVAMLPAKADYAAEMFMKGLLLNNADTGIIATTDQQLTQEQREQFTVALRERKRKAGTPDRPLFLSSGVKIEKPTISNVDMQFLETRRLLRQEIGAIFKVPESLMGFSEAKTSALSGGSNALNEEKLTFTEQVLSAHCHRIEAALAPIVKTFGEELIGWFDVEGLPIMQEARRSRLASGQQAFGLGYPVNIINKVYDLGFPDLPWGDTGYLPFNLQRAEDAAKEPEPQGPNPGETAPTDNANPSPINAALGFLAGYRNGNGHEPVLIRYSDDQPRDEKGRWTTEDANKATSIALAKTNAAYDQSEKASASNSEAEHARAIQHFREAHMAHKIAQDMHTETGNHEFADRHRKLATKMNKYAQLHQDKINEGKLGKGFGSVEIEREEQAVEIRRKPGATLWNRLQQMRKATQNLFESKVNRVMRDFRAKTLAKLDHVHLQDAFGERKGLTDIIFNAAEFGEALRVVLTSPIRDTLQRAGEELRSEIGIQDPWTYPPKEVIKFLEKRTQPIMQTGQTVRDQLNTTLDEGITAGETHQELSDRVRATFNRLVNGTELTESESRRIARTEAHVAYETARHTAIVDSGIEYKSWLTSHGPTVREGHAQAEEDYVDNPIPVEEAFEVTDDASGNVEQMMFPGDDSLGASLSNIINCQCVLLAAEKQTEEAGLTTYHVFGYGPLQVRETTNRI